MSASGRFCCKSRRWEEWGNRLDVLRACTAPAPFGGGVDDLIDGLIRLMTSSDSIIGPINIGNPVEFSMQQLATTILDLTGSRSQIVHRPLPQDDSRQRQPNIAKAEDLLGWKPKTALKEGLIKTIAYFENPRNMQSF